jgi:hypothetical protein
MNGAQRRPKPCDWATVFTRGTSKVEKHLEVGMEEKLEILKHKWFSKNPPQCPDEEFSVMAPDELVYIGRYSEGVVLRLNDKEDQITFLTQEMAEELARKLISPKI